MANIKRSDEISWWDRKYLTRSLAFGLLAFIFFWVLVERAKPPLNFKFERVPVISGIYSCCSSGGRSSKSMVGNISVNCATISFYEFLGTGRNDCGLKDSLNGQVVEAVGAITPSFGSRDPLTVQISSQGRIYYEINDERLRQLWISSSISGAFTLGFLSFIIFHAIQLIVLGQKSKTL